MKLKSTFLFLVTISGTLLFTQCKKDKTEEPATPNTPTTSGSSVPSTMTDMFAQNGVQPQSAQANMGVAQNMSMGSVKVNIPGGAFVTSSGAPVSGMVDLSVKGIFTKKDIILSGAPANSSGKLIATKGCIKVSASQNSQTLRVAPGANIYVDVPETSMNPAYNLKKFYAAQMSVNDPQKIWRPATDTASIPVTYDTLNNKYYYHTKLDSVAWLNTGYEWDTTATTTPVEVILDSTYTANNCAVYISLNGKMVVGALYPYGGGVFNIGGIPIGQNVYIIVIATKGGSYYSTFHQATIASGYSINLTPQSTTLTNIQNALLLLP